MKPNDLLILSQNTWWNSYKYRVAKGTTITVTYHTKILNVGLDCVIILLDEMGLGKFGLNEIGLDKIE